jgi:hypothetical protein
MGSYCPAKSSGFASRSLSSLLWDYLERTGELEEPEIASSFLLDAIKLMIRQGVRSRLLPSNRAITAYKRYKQQRQAA